MWQSSGEIKIIPYSVKLQGRKHLQIGEKYDFRRENFHGLLACAMPKDAMPPNFVEKTFANSHKTAKFAKIPPSKVFRYTVLYVLIVLRTVFKLLWHRTSIKSIELMNARICASIKRDNYICYKL